MVKELRGPTPFFIVGVARSGTTLLRWMLEEHPNLAIPIESHWIVDLAGFRTDWNRDRQAQVVASLLNDPKYRRSWMSEAALQALAVEPLPSYAHLVEAVFGLYAAARGKPRWGDKTPWYVEHIGLLHELFPAAVFLHLIRDGREVAASLLEMGERPSAAIAAAYWCKAVRSAQNAGTQLGRCYCELRLEDLIAAPESTLRRACGALGEVYTPTMLDYPRRASELERYDPRHRQLLRHLAKPPTPGLRDWRAGLSESECAELNAICLPLLRELGYQTD